MSDQVKTVDGSVSALEEMKRKLANIELRYSESGVSAGIELNEKKKKPAKAQKPKGEWSKFISSIDIKERPLVFVPELQEDREWIRYCLINTLYATGFDIAVSEFSYAGCKADIFATANNRAVEFEIKMSRSDYIKDFQKRLTTGSIHPLKHDMLCSGRAMMSRFYFVVPEGMVDAMECPKHCGLIYFDIHMKSGYLFTVVKTAPMLHLNFISAGTWSTIAKRFALKCRNITSRYINNKFKDNRSLGLWRLKP